MIKVNPSIKELKKVSHKNIIQLYQFAELGKSTTSILHDLINPLTLISLNLNLLKQKSKNPKYHGIDNIGIHLNRALKGTKDLERFITSARKHLTNRELKHKFSLAVEIKQAIKMLEYKSQAENVSISFKSFRNIYTYGNPIRFNQLIANLISNAIDAYIDSKTISKKIKINLKLAPNSVNLQIIDQGKGIKSKNLPFIFEPLFTTKQKYNGIGMGLYICKNIIEKDFKGTIKVKSRENLGAKFVIEFPHSLKS